MKRKFFYLLYVIIFTLLLIPGRVQSAQPLYVIFDNLDIITDTEGRIITNAFDDLYYKPIKNHVLFGDYVVKLPFSDATFLNYKITDFDAAIFPMGDTPLNYMTPGGITVLNKIKEMEAAGKRVIILGRSLLWQSRNNQPAQQFFYEYLGVDEVFKVSTSKTQGNTWTSEGYTINGLMDDTVANTTRRWGNLNRGENGLDPLPPWRFVREVEAFKVRQNDPRFIAIDWFSKVYDDIKIINYPMTDTIVGVRTYTPHSKMVFWCYGYEYLCAVGSIWRQSVEYQKAMEWLLYDVPSIGPNPKVTPNPLQFGGVQIGKDSVKSFVITNFGRQPLVVEDIYIFDDPTPYTVLSQTQFTIPPLDTHSVFVKFTPTEEGTITNSLYISWRRDPNNPSTVDLGIDLKGTGGKEINPGPIIDVIDTLDFGEVEAGKKKDSTFVIKNVGTAPLIVNYNNFSNNGQNNANGAFSYNGRVSGFQVNPDSTRSFEIRFAPQKPGESYIGEIKLETNQKGENPFSYIALLGNAAPDRPKIMVPTNVFRFDTTLVNSNSIITIQIKNTGTANLVIDNINFTTNDSSVFSIVEGIGEVPKTMVPQEIFELKIRFSPVDTILYNSSIKIKSNAYNFPTVDISLSGVGKPDTVGSVNNDGTVTAGNNLFSMKAMPNPSYGKTLLEYHLNGIDSRKVEIFVVDLLGKKILSLLDSRLEPGDYKLEFDLPARLASANYYIVANVAGTQARLPLVILK